MDADAAHGWAITIEAAGAPGTVTDDMLVDFVEALTDLSGVVTGSTDGSRYGATFSLDDPNEYAEAAWAADAGAHEFRDRATRVGLPPHRIVRLEAITYAEQEAELARPSFPELIGVAELADILGVTRQRASQIQSTAAGFPTPVARLASGPVWTRPSIGNFLETWPRKAGRPPTRDTGGALGDVRRSSRSIARAARITLAGAKEPTDEHAAQ